MSKKRKFQSDPRFTDLEKMSGLVVRKSYSCGSKKIMLILAQPDPKLTGEFDRKDQLSALNFLLENMDALLEADKKPDLDLETDMRYQMKLIAQRIFEINPKAVAEGTCDDIRLVQAGPECFIFIEKMVKNFRKTGKGYAWSWVTN